MIYEAITSISLTIFVISYFLIKNLAKKSIGAFNIFCKTFGAPHFQLTKFNSLSPFLIMINGLKLSINFLYNELYTQLSSEILYKKSGMKLDIADLYAAFFPNVVKDIPKVQVNSLLEVARGHYQGISSIVEDCSVGIVYSRKQYLVHFKIGFLSAHAPISSFGEMDFSTLALGVEFIDDIDMFKSVMSHKRSLLSDKINYPRDLQNIIFGYLNLNLD